MAKVPLGGIGTPHCPVLLAETMALLQPERGGIFVDGTVGPGGHTEAILKSSPQTRVIGIDRDAVALKHALQRLAAFGDRFQPWHGDFREIGRALEELGHKEVDGVLVDLGVSSLQLDDGRRGFSFRHDAALDMRMDATGSDPTASDLLGRLPEEEIARIIFEFGEEKQSRKIARAIVEARDRGAPVRTTSALASLVARIAGHRRGGSHIHPATRTFQALRIAVNRELEGLGEFVSAAVDRLKPGGRFLAISFHSLEDRMIKQALRLLSGKCNCPPRLPVCSCGARPMVEIITRRPVTPTAAEVEENPRARSAKLRACQKLS